MFALCSITTNCHMHMEHTRWQCCSGQLNLSSHSHTSFILLRNVRIMSPFSVPIHSWSLKIRILWTGETAWAGLGPLHSLYPHTTTQTRKECEHNIHADPNPPSSSHSREYVLFVWPPYHVSKIRSYIILWFTLRFPKWLLPLRFSESDCI
jgi:hypothetical protein